MSAAMPPIPAPEPLPLPAPVWLLSALLLLTFFLHLLAMNFVLGGSILTAVTRLRRKEEEHESRLRSWITSVMPTVVSAAVTFGVAALLFAQVLYGRVLLAGSIVMGWFWFAVIPIVILSYYGTYLLAFRKSETYRYAPTAVAVAIGFLTVAFIYVNTMSLMIQPASIARLHFSDAGGTGLNLSDATFFPRFIHMVLGAIAVAGAIVALYGLMKARTDAGHGTWAMRKGALWFTTATAGNVVAGIWWLIVLPEEILPRFMGGSVAATFWLFFGMAAGFAALVAMGLALVAAEPRREVTIGSIALVLSLASMVFTRDQVRRATLELAGYRLPEWVEPQWSVIALFLLLFVGAGVTITWMGRMLKAGAGG